VNIFSISSACESDIEASAKQAVGQENRCIIAGASAGSGNSMSRDGGNIFRILAAGESEVDAKAEQAIKQNNECNISGNDIDCRSFGVRNIFFAFVSDQALVEAKAKQILIKEMNVIMRLALIV
jgi:hypothetical protein